MLQLTQSIQVDEISFSSSTSSLANSNLWMRALGLLCTMACGVLRPHDAMYNSLTGSLENSGQWPFASSLLEEMICTRVLETCRSAHLFYHFVSFCYFNLTTFTFLKHFLASGQGYVDFDILMPRNSLHFPPAASTCRTCRPFRPFRMLWCSPG